MDVYEERSFANLYSWRLRLSLAVPAGEEDGLLIGDECLLDFLRARRVSHQRFQEIPQTDAVNSSKEAVVLPSLSILKY